MKFNSGEYNVSPFNISADSSLTNIVAAHGISSASKPLMKAYTRLFLKQANGVGGGILTLTVRIPIFLTPANAKFSVSSLLTIAFDLQLKSASGTSGSKHARIRTYELETIDLDGLILFPDETLVIDTDEITVKKDGISVIEYWQTGSAPFEFTNGKNIIIYNDDDTERNAQMSIVWRNRWL